MIEILEWSIIWYAFSAFVFGWLFHDEFVEVKILAMIYAVFNAFFPMDIVNQMLFSTYEERDITESFEEVEHQFTTDYDRSNPATKEAATRIYNKKFFNKCNKV